MKLHIQGLWQNVHKFIRQLTDWLCLRQWMVNVLFGVVYNWSVDNVISWLSEHVELGQYVSNFKANAIGGRALPRYTLAVLLL